MIKKLRIIVLLGVATCFGSDTKKLLECYRNQAFLDKLAVMNMIKEGYQADIVDKEQFLNDLEESKKNILECIKSNIKSKL